MIKLWLPLILTACLLCSNLAVASETDKSDKNLVLIKNVNIFDGKGQAVRFCRSYEAGNQSRCRTHRNVR
jgi:hypothetical protein